MTLKQFTTSHACTSGINCGTCRDRGERAFRASLGTVFVLPADAPDFECPHGKPWGYRQPENVADAATAIPLKSGPGTELKRLLESMGIAESSGCACASYAKVMDAWGPDECERRADEIIGKLLAEGGKRWWGKVILAIASNHAESKARDLLAEAIARARLSTG